MPLCELRNIQAVHATDVGQWMTRATDIPCTESFDRPLPGDESRPREIINSLVL